MKYALAVSLLAGAFLGGAAADAAIIKFEAVYEFSGAYPPTGQIPWLTTTFSDTATPGEVSLALEVTNLLDEEFVAVWMLNLDPTMNPADLVFSAPTKTGTFDDPSIATAVSAYSRTATIKKRRTTGRSAAG